MCADTTYWPGPGVKPNWAFFILVNSLRTATKLKILHVAAALSVLRTLNRSGTSRDETRNREVHFDPDAGPVFFSLAPRLHPGIARFTNINSARTA